MQTVHLKFGPGFKNRLPLNNAESTGPQLPICNVGVVMMTDETFSGVDYIRVFMLLVVK